MPDLYVFRLLSSFSSSFFLLSFFLFPVDRTAERKTADGRRGATQIGGRRPACTGTLLFSLFSFFFSPFPEIDRLVEKIAEPLELDARVANSLRVALASPLSSLPPPSFSLFLLFFPFFPAGCRSATSGTVFVADGEEPSGRDGVVPGCFSHSPLSPSLLSPLFFLFS